jgi:hypothetical protein
MWHRILKSHNRSSLADFSVIVHYNRLSQIIKSSNHVFGSSFRVHDSLTTTALGDFLIHTVAATIQLTL